jgi:hypothetical protein
MKVDVGQRWKMKLRKVGISTSNFGVPILQLVR